MGNLDQILSRISTQQKMAKNTYELPQIREKMPKKMFINILKKDAMIRDLLVAPHLHTIQMDWAASPLSGYQRIMYDSDTIKNLQEREVLKKF